MSDKFTTETNMTNVVIISGHGPDRIIFTIDLPNPCYPYTGGTDVRITAAAGKGKEWFKTHFPHVNYRYVEI